MTLDIRTVVDSVINDFGQDVTLVSRALGSQNIYGDADYGTTTSIITATIQPLTQEDVLVKEGSFRSGDIIFYIKSSDGGSITAYDFIQYNSLDYKVEDPMFYPASGNVQVYEIRTKKV